MTWPDIPPAVWANPSSCAPKYILLYEYPYRNCRTHRGWGENEYAQARTLATKQRVLRVTSESIVALPVSIVFTAEEF